MLTISGWWYTYPSEKYEFVSWDYHSQLNEKIENRNCLHEFLHGLFFRILNDQCGYLSCFGWCFRQFDPANRRLEPCELNNHWLVVGIPSHISRENRWFPVKIVP